MTCFPFPLLSPGLWCCGRVRSHLPRSSQCWQCLQILLQSWQRGYLCITDTCSAFLPFQRAIKEQGSPTPHRSTIPAALLAPSSPWSSAHPWPWQEGVGTQSTFQLPWPCWAAPEQVLAGTRTGCLCLLLRLDLCWISVTAQLFTSGATTETGWQSRLQGFHSNVAKFSFKLFLVSSVPFP